jgi:hypothetical protein
LADYLEYEEPEYKLIDRTLIDRQSGNIMYYMLEKDEKDALVMDIYQHCPVEVDETGKIVDRHTYEYEVYQRIYATYSEETNAIYEGWKINKVRHLWSEEDLEEEKRLAEELDSEE